ncbi:hypothetical protein [Haloplanus salinarum]|uniref:hypothetical protein n=1 Tax=Haloplanus salinarum TaxID=1912324 RepID=UPI00214BCA8D|nr:hypothetical protein [Haloplanus salinarum]
MAQNAIIAEDGSLIPTGDTQVTQVGEATYDASEADERTDIVVGGADQDDTFALEGDRVYDSGDVVDEESFDGGGSSPTPTSTDTTSSPDPTTTDTSTSSSTGESVREIVVPTSSGGGSGVGILAVAAAAVAVVGVLVGSD